MPEHLVGELGMTNLMETEKHSHLVVQNLCFEVELPLAQKVSAAAVVEMVLDLQEVEMAVGLQVDHVEGVLALLKDIVVLGNGRKVQR